MHPRQGASADGRGAAHSARRGRVRRADLGTDARPRHVAHAQARGHRPPDFGPRDVAEGSEGHRRPGHRHARARCADRACLGRFAGSRPQRAARDGVRTSRSSDRRPGLRRHAGHVVRPRPGARRGAAPGCGDRRRRDRVRVRIVPRRCRRRGHDRRSAAADPSGRRPAGRADGRARLHQARDQGAGRRAGARLRRHRARPSKERRARSDSRSMPSWSRSAAGRAPRTSGSTVPA